MFTLMLLSFVLGQTPTSHATDLRIDARLNATRVQLGAPIALRMSLVNQGRQALPVVKPGDGSESNWREPYVWFTAEREEKGQWVPVPKAQIGRCGLYDFDWVKDIVTLAPGASLTLKDWIDDPSYSVALDQPGRYRLQVHYAYGQASRSQPESKGAMRDVPPFEIVSAPLQLELVK